MPPNLVTPSGTESKKREYIAQRSNFCRGGYLGEETASALVRSATGNPPIRSLSDLFNLNLEKLLSSSTFQVDKQTRLQVTDDPDQYFANERGEAKINAYGLLFKLELAKESPLWRCLSSLSIRMVGSEVAKLLASRFDSLEEILSAPLDVLAEIPGVGSVIAEQITDWWAKPANKKLVQNWVDAGLTPLVAKQVDTVSGFLSGALVLVTGSLNAFDRDGVKQAIETAGGKAASGVSGNLTFAVVGEKAGPAKVKKLSELNVPILDEEDLKRILGGEISWQALLSTRF